MRAAVSSFNGLQQLVFAAGKKQETHSRQVLADVTQHYDACPSSLTMNGMLAMGTMGGMYGLSGPGMDTLPLTSLPLTCGQAAASTHAAAAAKVRVAGLKRQALRSMR
jgi:hypothetical protein